jgi:hypothetical protein
MTRRHPHEGRTAELYRRHPEDRERLIWVGYVADPPVGASWDDSIAGWILNDPEVLPDGTVSKSTMRRRAAANKTEV